MKLFKVGFAVAAFGFDVVYDEESVNQMENAEIAEIPHHSENIDLGWAGAREPRGWGEYYDWVNILDATEEFAEDKPILLLVIPEDCDDCVHCSAIREEFKNDQELLKISKHFHIVNFLGYEESQAHWDPKIANAHYFPRFYFLEAHGDIIPWAVNTLRKDDRVFYYNHASEILNTAKEVFHGYYKYKHDEL